MNNTIWFSLACVGPPSVHCFWGAQKVFPFDTELDKGRDMVAMRFQGPITFSLMILGYVSGVSEPTWPASTLLLILSETYVAV